MLITWKRLWILFLCCCSVHMSSHGEFRWATPATSPAAYTWSCVHTVPGPDCNPRSPTEATASSEGEGSDTHENPWYDAPPPPAPVTLCGFWLFISLVYFTCYKNLLDSFVGWFVIWLSRSIRSRLVWHLAPNVHLTRGLAQCTSLNMRWCPGS